MFYIIRRILLKGLYFIILSWIIKQKQGVRKGTWRFCIGWIESSIYTWANSNESQFLSGIYYNFFEIFTKNQGVIVKVYKPWDNPYRTISCFRTVILSGNNPALLKHINSLCGYDTYVFIFDVIPTFRLRSITMSFSSKPISSHKKNKPPLQKHTFLLGLLSVVSCFPSRYK